MNNYTKWKKKMVSFTSLPINKILLSPFRLLFSSSKIKIQIFQIESSLNTMDKEKIKMDIFKYNNGPEKCIFLGISLKEKYYSFAT